MKKNFFYISSILIFLFALSAKILPVFSTEPVYLHTPSDGSVIKNNCPVISFSIEGLDPDIKTLRFEVNNEDVTPFVMKMTSLLSYTVIKPLPDGENRVSVSFTNRNGEKTACNWKFIVQASNPIKSVEHDATTILDESRKLNVTIKGDSGYKAFFDIGELYKGIPMNEVSPGVYRGIYRIESGDNVVKADIRGNLVAPDGSRYFMKAANPVTIDTRLFKVTITEPANDSYVPQNFILKGHTKPGAQVKISTALSYSISGDTTTAAGKPNNVATIDADENGDFSQQLGFPASLRGMKMVVTVKAINDKGETSIPDTLTVNLKIDSK
ncbi:MAG: hypothetical protein LWY06_06190 [Firmicutes bacterium]|nr:hypothetical protein [Bacillota bacterium]